MLVNHIGSTTKSNVKNVNTNVMNVSITVKPMMKIQVLIVYLVSLSEKTSHSVTVQEDTTMMVFQLVKSVDLNVPLVTLGTTVQNVTKVSSYGILCVMPTVDSDTTEILLKENVSFVTKLVLLAQVELMIDVLNVQPIDTITKEDVF